MSQNSRVSGRATKVYTRFGITTVQYHDTAVVSFNANQIALNSGGWMTFTIKLRMNQASHQFDLGYEVVQRGGEWFVQFGKGDEWAELPFSDGMTLVRGEDVNGK